MSTGLVQPWELITGDIILVLDRVAETGVELHRYRVIDKPVVDWPNASTPVRCEEGGMAINFILPHDERVLVTRETTVRDRRMWTRRREMQNR